MIQEREIDDDSKVLPSAQDIISEDFAAKKQRLQKELEVGKRCQEQPSASRLGHCIPHPVNKVRHEFYDMVVCRLEAQP